MSFSRLTDFTPHTTRISFWQSVHWRQILLDSHQAEEVFYYGDQIHFLLVEIRTIWARQRGAMSLWVLPDQLGQPGDELIHSLMEYLRWEGILYFQLEPLEEIDTQIDHAVRPYRHFLTPYTREIFLDTDETAILQAMHEKWRYNIRLAEKRWVTVQKVDPTPENIDIWINLLSDTTQRDGFFQNSRIYYQVFLEQISKNNAWWLYFASFEWSVISAGIFVFYDNRWIYYYGASSSDPAMRKHMAPYLLQWHAIQEAKSRGLWIYDFLWVADPLDPLDPLLGVTNFKEKFWWQTKKLPTQSLVPLFPLKYRLFLLLRKIFWKK